MSGYCQDCGNTMCLCDDIQEEDYYTKEQVLEMIGANKELKKAGHIALCGETECMVTKQNIKGYNQAKQEIRDKLKDR